MKGHWEGVAVFIVLVVIAGAILYYGLTGGSGPSTMNPPAKRPAILVIHKGQIVHLDTTRLDSIIFQLYGRIYAQAQEIAQLRRQLQLFAITPTPDSGGK